VHQRAGRIDGIGLQEDGRTRDARGLAALEAFEQRQELNRFLPELGRQRLAAALKDLGAAVSDADLVKEVAIFAERSDIAEEIARLGGHVEQFRSIIEPSNPQPAGRALDFLAQEMLREANTIASKSGDVEISRRVVEIKTAIDRIKEQAQNAE
jgi:uncharacterized protein (TIGR00255 family)